MAEVEIKVDPLTRIEGHVGFTVKVKDGKVTEAKAEAAMFRGFEIFLKGRNPRDAYVIAQRICGVCPAAHAMASIKNLDMAFGYRAETPPTTVPKNATRIRNVMFAANYVMSHILHQYHLTGFDYLVPNPDVLVTLAKLTDWATIAGFIFGIDPIGAPGSVVFGPPATSDVAEYVRDTLLIKQLGVPESVADLVMNGGYVPVESVLLGVYGLTPALKDKHIQGYKKLGGASWVAALRHRADCQKIIALFGGKMPHHQTYVPGGVTVEPTIGSIATAYAKAAVIKEFVRDVVLRDMAFVVKWRNLYFPPPGWAADTILTADAFDGYKQYGVGPRRFLSYGGFEDPDRAYYRFLTRGVLHIPETGWAGREYEDFDPASITEYVKHSWYSDECSKLNPKGGKTIPAWEKAGAYSWAKSPRYKDKVHEVGPHARIVVSLHKGKVPQPAEELKALASEVPILGTKDLSGKYLYDAFDEVVKTPSCLGRIAARAYEAWLVAKKLPEWIVAINPTGPVYLHKPIPDTAESMGLTEAPRGALGHWMKIKGKKIDNYQVITPTAWNISPRDDNNQPGPAETALQGGPESIPTPVADVNNPLEILKVLHSFDFCLACTVHVIDVRTKKKKICKIC